MPTNVILPKQGLLMTEGMITRWIYREGDRVEQGRPLFEMETDKTTVSVDAPVGGVLLKIVRGEFETVPVAEVVAVIGGEGEAENALTGPQAGLPAGEPPERETCGRTQPGAAAKAGARAFATPRARTAAAQAGLDWAAIPGSGPDGLVIERDVLSRKPGDGLPPMPGEETVELTPMRRAIWEAMSSSVHSMAHARHRVHADMTEAVKLRDAFRAAGGAVSFNDILILALCRALREYPELNSSAADGGIVRRKAVHMGLAVALDAGLVVPTIFNADGMTLRELHEAASQAVDKARRGALKPGDCRGGTFTLTNLGMYGIDEFDAIVNPPQAAILAVGRIADAPAVRGGQVVARAMAWLTLTYDHRIVDGAPAAKFLRRVAAMLENPVLML